MGTLDPAKTFFRLPWIWGWIQQKRFFGSPGFGGGSSKNVFSAPLDLGVDPAKKLVKVSKKCLSTPFWAPLQLLKFPQHPFLGSPSTAQIPSAPLFGHPFSCSNFLSTPFSVPLSYVYSNSMIQSVFQISLLSMLNTLRSSPSLPSCSGANNPTPKNWPEGVSFPAKS